METTAGWSVDMFELSLVFNQIENKRSNRTYKCRMVKIKSNREYKNEYIFLYRWHLFGKTN